MSVDAKATERLWRLRKDHTSIDARLCDRADTGGVELHFYYDGALVVVRPRSSRAAAVAEAEAQLKELQRAGWTTHW